MCYVSALGSCQKLGQKCLYERYIVGPITTITCRVHTIEYYIRRSTSIIGGHTPVVKTPMVRVGYHGTGSRECGRHYEMAISVKKQSPGQLREARLAE